MISRLSDAKKVTYCVVSAPGCDRSAHCATLAKEFDLEQITVAEGLSDDEAVAAVENGIKAASKSVILDGFPATKVQARALQNMKVVPEKVFFLRGDPEKVMGALREKAESEDMAEAKLQQHLRHFHGIFNCYKNCTTVVDLMSGASIENQVGEAIKRAGGDPRGPLRCCVVGPVGSGRTTQATAIANDFGAVHVDLAKLCNASGTEILGSSDED